ncbi:MmcQ/YjbR family DNA-binding protein [Dactylosporangium sp. NPDC000521]|uniref:MmcQ/YjbR family DNA-binding protein n=1 Tax=Dactylosporangium sp. NPDC000521 TaxID=3363975 RepID=UPI0036BB98A3
MTRDELIAHCISKPGAWQDTPWEDDLVVKVGAKIFAFLGSGAGDRATVGVKCAPSREAADEWLRRFPEDAVASPYIGRSGWNTLTLGGKIPDEELLEAVDESYRWVVSKLPKKDRPQ